eukprot:2123983-Pyramimonas_sp.AAC.1
MRERNAAIYPVGKQGKVCGFTRPQAQAIHPPGQAIHPPGREIHPPINITLGAAAPSRRVA